MFIYIYIFTQKAYDKLRARRRKMCRNGGKKWRSKFPAGTHKRDGIESGAARMRKRRGGARNNAV